MDDSRRPLVVGAIIAVASVGVLFTGSQIARERGQAVDWYTGFGQWLGALASFIAAGAALWIATSDRRFSMAERKRIEEQHDADLSRQAGLVQVTVELLGQRQAVGPTFATASVGVRNRRSDRIFDLAVTKFVHAGKEVELTLERVNGFYVCPIRKDGFHMSEEFPELVLNPDDFLVIYQPGSLPNTVADFAAVQYTDSQGRRWEVDTDGGVKRL